MDRQNPETPPAVSLDASKLLGFCNLARIVAPDETVSVVELSRLLSKIGDEVPNSANGLQMGRLLNKIGAEVPDTASGLHMGRLLSKIGTEVPAPDSASGLQMGRVLSKISELPV